LVLPRGFAATLLKRFALAAALVVVESVAASFSVRKQIISLSADRAAHLRHEFAKRPRSVEVT
jgi:hypothetical protein